MIDMDMKKLRSKLDRGEPVGGAAFLDTDWTDFNCENAKFTDSGFDQAQFSNVVFSGTKFVRCKFQRCCFFPRRSERYGIRGVRFYRSGRTGPVAPLRSAICGGPDFWKCDLSLCQIERSDLFSIEMDQCVLRGARFHKVDFSHAYSRKLVTTRATFRGCNMELVDLSEARLATCDFTGSRLREADFTAADLTDAVLRESDLFQAILMDSKLAGADLRGAEISGLNLMALASFAGMKINQSQQHNLLLGVGIDVCPEPD